MGCFVLGLLLLNLILSKKQLVLSVDIGVVRVPIEIVGNGYRIRI